MKFGRGGLIEIRMTGGDGLARFEVRDHGIGIPDDKMERIFELYERGDSPLHHGGLGMGLFIAREIVKAHGGWIEAVNVAREGSRFTVTLPLS